MFFFFNDTAPSEIYTLSLHDALPILVIVPRIPSSCPAPESGTIVITSDGEDRKSTRLNSSHVEISYAVFCLKKKRKREPHRVDPEISRHHSSSSCVRPPHARPSPGPA